MNKLQYSRGIPLPFSGDDLLQNFGYINLKNGQTSITAVKDFSGVGTAGFNASGGLNFYSNGFGAQGQTVSYRGAGTQFFTTPTANANQQIAVGTQGGAGTLKVTQSASASNQNLTTRLASLSLTQWALIGGAVVAAVLLFNLVRR